MQRPLSHCVLNLDAEDTRYRLPPLAHTPSHSTKYPSLPTFSRLLLFAPWSLSSKIRALDFLHVLSCPIFPDSFQKGGEKEKKRFTGFWMLHESRWAELRFATARSFLTVEAHSPIFPVFEPFAGNRSGVNNANPARAVLSRFALSIVNPPLPVYISPGSYDSIDILLASGRLYGGIYVSA